MLRDDVSISTVRKINSHIVAKYLVNFSRYTYLLLLFLYMEVQISVILPACQSSAIIEQRATDCPVCYITWSCT